MGKALELISGRVTAAGATFTPATMASGNTLTVRNAPLDSDVRLLQLWTDHQAAGVLRIRSPKLHDNVQGLRFRAVPSETKPLMPWGSSQKLIPQDTLVAEMTGSAVAGDIDSFAALLYYANLSGSDARLISADEVLRRAVELFTWECTITTGAGGGYTGEQAMTAQFDLSKANTDYALLGYLVDVECCAVRWRGADTANLGVGGPGDELGRDYTGSWFLDLSRYFGLPLVPVFNSANKSAILVDAVQDENAAAVVLTSIFAELGAGGAAPAR